MFKGVEDVDELHKMIPKFVAQRSDVGDALLVRLAGDDCADLAFPGPLGLCQGANGLAQDLPRFGVRGDERELGVRAPIGSISARSPESIQVSQLLLDRALSEGPRCSFGRQRRESERLEGA